MWVEVRGTLRQVSPLLRQAQDSCHQEEVERALLTRVSDVTALRYLGTVQQLLAFLRDTEVDLEQFTAVQLVDAVFSLRADPTNKIHATNSLKAIRWITRILRLPWDTASPLLQIFDAPKDRQRRESLPLPLAFVAQLERLLRASDLPTQHRIFCGSLLLMVSASLRFSDMLHLEWKTLSLDGFNLRGVTYRSKTSCQGMPWATACEGFLGSPVSQAETWPALYLQLLGNVWDEVWRALGDEFLLDTLFFSWHCGEFAPLSYGQTLCRLRALLREFSPDDAMSCESYTLHSAKATFLAWMAELLLHKHARHRQGHHRGDCADLYARDDTWEALSAQRSVIGKVRAGWLPSTPIGRGGQVPLRSSPFNRDLAALEVASQYPWFQYAAPVPEPPCCSDPVVSPAINAVVDVPVAPARQDASPVIYESESDSEPTEDHVSLASPPDASAQFPPRCAEDFLWVRSGSGVAHVAVTPKAEVSATVRAACGASFEIPWLRTQYLTVPGCASIERAANSAMVCDGGCLT